ncbi:hypothetical protein GO003_006305 [Methylicorpusculum oleiharenae]|uniref:hypothetical protein n=1 Tax=Methylicorpusculum oleiharenae TaxID=1338687 RepID=UPI001E62070F|nr:hypothetical protein [Methylicorpusculum oleiharenae]MCD2449997.1 hypothetical protein [Methylicorpusculum oleiharenae]
MLTFNAIHGFWIREIRAGATPAINAEIAQKKTGAVPVFFAVDKSDESLVAFKQVVRFF